MNIFFNASFLHNTLLLISGTNDGSKFPSIDDTFDHFTSNDKAAYYSPGKLIDYDEPVCVLVGNSLPNKTKVIGRARFETDSKRIYVGDIKLESFLIVQMSTKTVDIVVSVNFSDKQPVVYVQVKSANLNLVSQQSLYPSEDVQADIDKLGKTNGCHVCGSKNKGHYIPHLFPPLEIKLTGEKDWYPVCREDFDKYDQEVLKIKEDMI